ncbi:MAG: hypothetical protein ABIQ66_04825 [Novosphingobium sp.]
MTARIAVYCLIGAVSALGIYGFLASSYVEGNLSESDMSKISGCYKWKNYAIAVSRNKIVISMDNNILAESMANFRYSRDVSVTSHLGINVDNDIKDIKIVNKKISQKYIYTSELNSPPYFRVFNDGGGSVRFLRVSKNTDCIVG